MDFNEYQKQAKTTAVFPENTAVVYTVLGLLSEAGEVADKVKKVIRDQDGVFSDSTKDAIKAELGDVLWYVALASDAFGFDMNDVAAGNLEKLFSRQSRGVLGGSGDNR